MEKKNIKITTSKQFQRLVQLMEENPEIGRGKVKFGCSKQTVKEKWNEFTVELNNLGPPTRNWNEWQRVWIHYKAKLKRKLANNWATEGGPIQEISLNPLEESVTDLIQMTRRIGPIESIFVVENEEPPASSTPPATSISPAPSAASTTTELPPIQSHSSHHQIKRNALEKERLDMLKEQANNQKNILKTLEKLEKSVYNNYLINKQLLELNQAAKNGELHNLRVECLKLKIAKLKKDLNM